MSTDQTQALLSVEAEAYVDALEVYDLKDVGCEKWSRQHEYIEKLNMQAVISASAQEEEFVKEYLITAAKIPLLIQDLLSVEIWKQKIFTEFSNINFQPKTTFPIYMVLYHEATVANLLETVLFHRESCEVAEDSMLDLLDYCYRKLAYLTARSEVMDDEEEETKADEKATNLEDLQKQNKKMDFDISIKAVSILRYITDHLSTLPLSVMTRLLNTHDVPILLVQLVENPPWTRDRGGHVMKYVDNKWQEFSHQDSMKLSKIEGQVWLTLYHLLMDQDCQRKYELDDHKKNSILKLRRYLTEVMLDQIPALVDMQRYLETLSMMEPPVAKRELVLEQVPEIRDRILNQYAGKWKTIAKKQAKTFFSPTVASMKAQAERLAATYNFDVLEGLLSEPPRCVVCGEQATKRCSRCRNEWYCRRECQVGHWPKHKTACNLVQETNKKAEEMVKNSS
ncbi:zinc finger MYND domain-containing protein 10-like [Lineus longissimus]|uniref:zinc finger MYND domain-containing protein 10-like n=1 Tax=Lineus longissimus TaxID=88925 RepID=UPI002B4EB108